MKSANEWLSLSKEEMDNEYEKVCVLREYVETELKGVVAYRLAYEPFSELLLSERLELELGLEYSTEYTDINHPPLSNERYQLANDLERVEGWLESEIVRFRNSVKDAKSNGGIVGNGWVARNWMVKVATDLVAGMVCRLNQDWHWED